MADFGYENNKKTRGLGLINGEVKILPKKKIKIPHLGWNEVKFKKKNKNLNDISNKKNVVMLLANKFLKVALATTHLPLKEVSKNITTEKLENILKILINELKQKWKLKNPKICVLGLNPHAGENGFLGSEEIEVIKPVIDKLKKNKLNSNSL